MKMPRLGPGFLFSDRRDRQEGFTRVELLAAVSGALLLVLLALPLLGNTRLRTERLVCVSNLGHVGRAYQRWASDHGDRTPFLVETNEGGLRGHPLARNAWIQYAWISNELVTAKALACPSDAVVRPALDFSTSSDGGFAYPGYRNNAVSYFVGLHAFFSTPQSILSGDRNVRPDMFPGDCNYARLTGVPRFYSPPFGTAEWTAGLHHPTGNLLFNDTHVSEAMTQDLRQALSDPNGNFTSMHAILPR